MAATIPSETTTLLNEAHVNNLERVVSNVSGRSRYGSSSGARSAVLKGDDSDFETTYKDEAILLANYSIPLVVTYMLQYSYSLITVIVAGQLGTSELAASSLASMTANITGLCVYEGLATCLDTLTSQAYGAGRKKLVGLHVQRMMALMLVVTIPIGALWMSSPWLISLVVPEKDTALLAGQFMRIYLIGAPGFGLFEAGKRFSQAQGQFWPSLVPVLICAPLNLLWNWLFVFKWNLGFQGVALAVAVSNLLQPIVLLLYINIFARHTLECWPTFSLKGCFQNWGHMIRLGVPGIAMVLSEWLAFDVLTIASGWLSKEILAAESVLMTVAVTMYHIPMPVAVAAATRFGNLIGHGALKAARKAILVYYAVFVVIGIFDLVLLISLAHPIATGFTNDPAVREIIVKIIPVVALAQGVDAFACIANGLLRGLGKQKIGGWVNLLAYYAWALPIALFLTFGPLKMGLLGLWIGPLTGLLIVGILVTIYIKTLDWQKAVEEARSRDE